MATCRQTDALSPRGARETPGGVRWRRVMPLLGACALVCLTAIVTAAAAHAGRSSDVVAGREWKLEPTPNPATAAISVLSSVACASRRACTAVGSSALSFSSPTLTLAERWNGRRWLIQPIPTPSGTSDSLYGVSCPSANACMAVGSAFHTAGGRQTILTEAWNGKRWRVEPTPTIAARDSSLYAVSCTSQRSCMAVGFSLGSPSHAIVERWDGTSWRLQATPQLAKSTDLLGVSCSTARACAAVGWNNVTGNARPLAESWNGNEWHVQPVRVPQGEPGGVFDAVSCTTPRACTATGTDFNPGSGGPTLAERWNGKTWRVQRTPSPANSSLSSSEVALDGVSCTSAKACTAIGEYTPDHAAAYFIESWNGKRWRLKAAPRPVGFVHGALLGISCVSARCTAVGAYTGNNVRPQVTLAMAN